MAELLIIATKDRGSRVRGGHVLGSTFDTAHWGPSRSRVAGIQGSVCTPSRAQRLGLGNHWCPRPGVTLVTCP